jgi:hypothetical protein
MGKARLTGASPKRRATGSACRKKNSAHYARLGVLHFRVLQHGGHEPAHHGGRHEVEHDRVDHLVRAAPGAEPTRDPAPHRAHGAAHGHGEERREHGRKPGHGESGPGGGKRRHVELAFRADVEEARVEGHRHRQASEDERRGVVEGGAEVHRAVEGAVGDHREHVQGAVALEVGEEEAEREPPEEAGERAEQLLHRASPPAMR